MPINAIFVENTQAGKPAHNIVLRKIIQTHNTAPAPSVQASRVLIGQDLSVAARIQLIFRDSGALYGVIEREEGLVGLRWRRAVHGTHWGSGREGWSVENREWNKRDWDKRRRITMEERKTVCHGWEQGLWSELVGQDRRLRIGRPVLVVMLCAGIAHITLVFIEMPLLFLVKPPRKLTVTGNLQAHVSPVFCLLHTYIKKIKDFN
jgi:hypothetical protein